MIEKIQHLKWVPFDKRDFVVIGSAVLVAHCVDIVNNDLDIAVRPEILNNFLSKRGASHDQNYVICGHIKLSCTGSKMFNKINTGADIIKGYSFMSLLDLRNMYILLDREKDMNKIFIINDLLYR
jgi:hypothetical protein